MGCRNCLRRLGKLLCTQAKDPPQLVGNFTILILIYSTIVLVIVKATTHITTAARILSYNYYSALYIPFMVVLVAIMIPIIKRFPTVSRYVGIALVLLVSIISVEFHYHMEPTLIGYCIANMITVITCGILLAYFAPIFFIGPFYHIAYATYYIFRWFPKRGEHLQEYYTFILYGVAFCLQCILCFYCEYIGKTQLIDTHNKVHPKNNAWTKVIELIELPIFIFHNSNILLSNSYANKLFSSLDKQIAVLSALQSNSHLDLNGKKYSAQTQSIVFNDIQCTISILYDNTNLVNDEQQICVNKMVSSITHELRSPLNIISTILKLIADNPTKDNRALVSKGLSACMIQENLINDIIDISKITNGKLTINNQPTNIVECSNDIVSLFQIQTDPTKLDLKFITQGEVPSYLLIDEKRYKQIIINLISNALKFTKSGSINFTLNYSAPYLHGKVDDTGIGIKAEDFAKIFTHFGMVESSSSLNKSGSGIGLHLVKQLCQLMGGDISFTSTYLKGSSFEFKVSALGMEGMNHPVVQHICIDYEKEIVAIDDTQMILNVLKALFERLQLPHKEFRDPIEATTYVLQNSSCIRMALIDLNMPKMDGYEVAAALRNTGIHLVCLSGEDCDTVSKRCLECGFNEILEKPISYQKLKELLAHH